MQNDMFRLIFVLTFIGLILTTGLANARDSYAPGSGGSDGCIVPYKGMAISSDTRLCFGNYTLSYNADGPHILGLSHGDIIINSDNVVLDCSGSPLYGVGIGIENNGHHNVTIQNCELYNYDKAVYFYNNADGEIKGSQFFNNNYSVYLDTGSLKVENNEIFGGGHGVYETNGGVVDVEDNNIFNTDYGVYLTNGGNTVMDNHFSSNHYHIFVHADDDSDCVNTVTGNSELNNVFEGRDILYYDSQVDLSDVHAAELILCNADNSNIDNVTVMSSDDNSTSNGILLIRTDYSNITNSDSRYNHRGIALYSSSHNNISHNLFDRNGGYGIFSDVHSQFNVFNNNHVCEENGTYDIYDETDNDNTYSDNYCGSRFTGVAPGNCDNACTGLTCQDIDRDGYGVCPNCGIVNGCWFDGNDCVDYDSSRPTDEVCNNGIDDDCDGWIDDEDPDCGAVDLNDPATWDPDNDGNDNVVNISGRYMIVDDVRLVPDVYNIIADPLGSPAIDVNCSDCVIDCNGATINGTKYGTGIENDGNDNVTLTNCIVNDYDTGVKWDASNGHIENNGVCLNDVDIRLSSTSHGNTGDNTCGTLRDDDSNNVICSTECFSASHCVDFSNPATWDYNNNGLPDIVQDDIYVYRIVESTKICPNQDFIRITLDDDVELTCGRDVFKGLHGSDNHAKGTEFIALILNNNSTIRGCGFAGDYPVRVVINGSDSKLIDNVFSDFSVDVNGSNSQIIGNKFYHTNGIRTYSDNNLIFDNIIDGDAGYESYDGSSVVACNQFTTSTAANLYDGRVNFEYNKITSTNGLNVTDGSGEIYYNNIDAVNGIYGLDNTVTGSYVLRGNILDYRFGTMSIDWLGSGEFYDNAFCSGTTNVGSGPFENNYCDGRPDCLACEEFDTRMKNLQCPYEYVEDSGKLKVISQPPDYDYTENISGETYYVKEVYTDDDLNCTYDELLNRIYPTSASWSLESDPLNILQHTLPMNKSIDLDNLRVTYWDIYSHDTTVKGQSYLCHVKGVDKSYTDIAGDRYEKFVIINKPPEIIALHPDNESTFPAGNVTVWAEAVDADNDPLTFTYHVIYPNGTEVVHTGDNYTEEYLPGIYEWYVNVSDGEAWVESEHYVFTVYRTSDISDIVFEPEGDGAQPGVVDTLDNLLCRVRPAGTFGLDYDAVQFTFFINGVQVYDEIDTVPNGDWFESLLSYDNTTKHDNVTCVAYTIWDDGGWQHDPDNERNLSLIVENTPPEIVNMSPENHTTTDQYVAMGDVPFEVDAEDVDDDSLSCHLVIDGIDNSYHDEFDSATCEFVVNLDVGQYEWYVEVSDGESVVTSETRHLNVAPIVPHVDNVTLEQLNGVRDYWETYDDMRVNVTLSNYSSNTVVYLLIGNDCDYVNDKDDYSCSEVLADEVIPCGSGECSYILDHEATVKHDNLTIYVSAGTTGTWNIESDNDWIGNAYIQNIPPEFEELSPVNNSVFTIFDEVVFSYPAEDLDSDSLNYTLHVYHDGTWIWGYEGPNNSSSRGSSYPAGNYTWNVIVTDGDNQTYSGVYHFEVIDPRPSGTVNVTVYPVPGTGYMDSRIETFDDIGCNITVNGDADYLIIKWLRNGVEVSSEQVSYDNITRIYSHENTTKHDNITCEVTPVTDYPGTKGYYYGESVSDWVVIQNIPPAVPTLIMPPNTVTLRGNPVTFNSTYDDPDVEGDSVTVHYYVRKIPDTTYTEVSSPATLEPGAYEWYAQTYDGEEYSNESEHWTFILSSSIVMPLVDNLTITPQPVYVTSDMACSGDVQGVNEDVDVIFKWETWNGVEWTATGDEWRYNLPDDENWHHYQTTSITGMDRHLLWRCAVYIDDGSDERLIDYTTTEISNSPPTVNLVSPLNDSVVESPVEFIWAGNDPDVDESLTYDLYVDNVEVYSGSDTTYTYDIPGTGNHEWWVVVSDGEDKMESEHWTFMTAEFPCPVVDVTPDEPTNDDDLVCNVTGDVSDLASVFGTVYADIRWYKNGVFSGEGDNMPCNGGCQSVLSYTLTQPGDNWTCKARYYVEYNNDVYTGNCEQNDSVVIVNHAPEVHLITPPDGSDIVIHSTIETVYMEWEGNDPDGDTLNYTLYINGNPIDMGTYTNYDFPLSLGEYEWYVTATDGYETVESEHWTFNVTPMYPCEISMKMDNTAIEGGPITVGMEVSDNIRSLSHEWGTPIVASLHCSDDSGETYDYVEECEMGCSTNIPQDLVQEDDNWTCSYYLQKDWDDDEPMSCIINDSVIVQPNQPPIIVLVSPENNTQVNSTAETVDVMLEWDGDDPEGHELVYKFVVQSVDSFDEITPTTRIDWDGSDENYTVSLRPGVYEWYVVADDGHTMIESEHWLFTVFPDMGCEHWLRVDPEPVYEGDETHVVLYTAPNIAERVHEDWGVDDIAYTITCKDYATGDVIAQQCEDNDYEKSDMTLPSLTAGQDVYCEGYLSTSCSEQRLSCITNKSFSVNVNHAPTIDLLLPEDGNHTNITTENQSIVFTWDGNDEDGDELNYTFHIQPIYHYGSIETSPEQDIETTDEYATVDLRPGVYEWYVSVSDGRETVESEQWTVYIFPDLGCGITIDRSPDIVYAGDEVHVIAHYNDEMLQRAAQWGAEFTGIVECSDDLGHHEYGTTNPAIGDTHTAKINISSSDVVEGANWECEAFGSLNADTPFSCIVNDTFTVGNAPPEVYLVSPENDSEFTFAEDAAKTVQLQWRTDDPENEPVRCMLHITNIDTGDEYEQNMDVFPWINFNLAVYFDPVNGTYEWYVNCSDGTNHVESEHWTFDVNVNHAPSVELISPQCGSEIEAGPDGAVDVTFEWGGTDNDGDTLNYNLNVNGLNVPIGSDESYTMEELSPGEYDWYVTVDDGVNPPVQSDSCHLTVTEFYDDPPVVSGVTVFPHPPPISPDDLRGLGCAFNVNDPDNDEVTATVKWYINGEYVEGYDWTGICPANGEGCMTDAELPQGLDDCTNVTCEAQAYDGYEYSEPINSSEWSNWDDSCDNVNHAPSVELISPDDEQLFCAHELNINYEWDGNDEDGDALSYDLHIINPDGDDEVITTSDDNANHWVTSEGVHEWYVVADDSELFTESVHRHFEVLAQPTISLSSSNPDGSTITPGQEIQFSVVTSSNDITYAWDDGDYAPVVCSEPLYKYLYICSVDVPDDLESGEHHLHIIANNNGRYGACSDDESYTFNVGSDENHPPVITLTNPEDDHLYSVSSGECPHIGMTWDVYDEDGGTVSCELHILGPGDLGEVVKERDPGVNYYYNNLCSVFGVSNPDELGGTYEWYVNCSDGENEVESEHREFVVRVAGENHPPTVELVSPENETTVCGNGDYDIIDYEWDGNDPDGDPLNYELHIEPVGSEPTVITTDMETATHGAVHYGSIYNWYVIADDGELIGESEHWAFELLVEPYVYHLIPGEGSNVMAGDEISFYVSPVVTEDTRVAYAWDDSEFEYTVCDEIDDEGYVYLSCTVTVPEGLEEGEHRLAITAETFGEFGSCNREVEYTFNVVEYYYPCELSIEMNGALEGEPITVDMNVSDNIRELSDEWGTPVIASLHCSDGTDSFDETLDCHDGCRYEIPGESVHVGDVWSCEFYLQKDWDDSSDVSCTVTESTEIQGTVNCAPCMEYEVYARLHEGESTNIDIYTVTADRIYGVTTHFTYTSDDPHLLGFTDMSIGEEWTLTVPPEFPKVSLRLCGRGVDELGEWVCIGLRHTDDINRPPQVTLVSPEDGANIHFTPENPDLTFEWDGNDLDGDELTYELHFICSAGSDTEDIIVYSGSDESYTTHNLFNSGCSHWYVTVSDGTDTVTSEERWFNYDYELPCNTNTFSVEPNPATAGDDLTLTLELSDSFMYWADYWDIPLVVTDMGCRGDTGEYLFFDTEIDCSSGTCSVIVPDVPEGTLECDAYYPWGLDSCQNTKTVTVSGENRPPQVTLVSPEQWQVFEDEFNIHFEWSTYDDDGDTVTSELYILNDNTGEEWEYDVGTGASFDWTAPDYDEYSWWVVVNDGTYTTESERWPFMIIRSEQIRVLSPENNTLFIQPTHNGDMDITVEWSGPDGDYDLCIQNADGSGSPECSTATGHSGTVTLKDTVGYTAEDYKIWVEHDGEVSEPVIVSYKDDINVVAPVAVFFGMEDDKLVCRGKVIARDDRAIGQTRSASVAILKLNPYDALINNHSDLIINDDSSYIEASVDDPESGDYKCNVGVTLLTGPSYTYDFATYTVAKALQIPIKPKPNFKPKPISLPTTLPVKPVKPEPIKPTSIISTPEKNKSISTMTSTQIKKPTSINYKMPVSSIFVKPVKNDDTKKGLTMFNYAHIKTNKHQ